MIRLFRVFIPVGVLALLLSEILLITSSFVLATYIELEVDPTIFLLYDGGLLRISLVVIAIIIGLHLHDLYSRIHVKSRIVLIQQLCLVMGLAFMAQGLISYLNKDLRVPAHVMVVGSAIAIVAIFGWRILYSAYVLRVVGAQKFLFVGGSGIMDEIAEYLQEHPEMGLAAAGFVDDAHAPGTPRAGTKVLGPMSTMREVATAIKPERIVVGMTERRTRMPVGELLELRFSGFIIEEAASVYETICGRVCTKELRPSQLIFSGELGPRPQSVMWQTLFNLILGLVAVLVSWPLMLLAALLVKVSSSGPILYRQVRVGQDGRLFTLYKFRSMYADAERLTGAVWASRNDPRITSVGRWLRKLRIDELPQLLNVLRGEMSLVGPRPERPEFVKALAEQIPYYRQRHCLKPGITGWAQINHKYGDTMEDTIKKLEYDLYYIKNVSRSLDTYIIFHTLKTMLLSKGAQ